MEDESTVPTRSGKRRRNTDKNSDGVESEPSPSEIINGVNSTVSVEELIAFSKELELEIAHAIFDVGLKVSSPKLLLALMPEVESLSTEHIKSHLQKYRMHHTRNNQEFNDFFDEFISLHNAYETTTARNNNSLTVTDYSTNNSNNFPNLSRSTSTNKLDDYSDSGSRSSHRKRSVQKLNEQAEELINEWQTLHERAIEIVKNLQG